MKRILFILALLFSSLAGATTYYVSDCQTGADPACVAGDDSRTTTEAQVSTTPWRTTAGLTAARVNALAAGSSVLFARGGSWTGWALAGITNLNVSRASPLTFDSYAPAWGPGTAKPLIENKGRGTTLFALQNGGASTHDEGYVLQNLSLTGGTTAIGTLTSATATTGTDSGASWTTNQFAGMALELLSGTGNSGTSVAIISNTATTLTVASWPAGTPDATTHYFIVGATYGLLTSNDVWHVTVDNVDFNGMELPINCNGGTGGSGIGASGDGTSNFYTIKNSTFSNSDNGILMGCGRTLIENNTFTNIGRYGARAVFDHAIYLDDGVNAALVAYPFRAVQIRHNTFTNNSTAGAGNCATTVIVVHGLKSGVEIEDNYFNETSATGIGGCWHISVNFGYAFSITPGYSAEGFDRLRIRRNKMVNFGGLAIDVGISHDADVSDNSMYTEYASGATCVQLHAPIGALEADDYQQTRNVVRGNSCFIKTPTAASVGYSWGRHASDAAGTGFVFANNLAYFGTGATTATTCFKMLNYTASEFTYWGGNFCYGLAAEPKWHSVSGTKAAWTTASGTLNADADSVNPTSASLTVTQIFDAAPSSPSWSLGIPVGSPANAAGNATNKSRIAFDGCLRPVLPSIGAREYRAVACNPAPNSPSGLR